jgi:hypothetical protein
MASFADLFNPAVRNSLANELRNIIDSQIDASSNTEDDCGIHPHFTYATSINSSCVKFVNGTLFVELPGVSKSDIQLNISDEGMVSITAERGEPFKKLFNYSYKIDVSKYDISSTEDASFENGILRITFLTISVKESSKTRNIKIN